MFAIRLGAALALLVALASVTHAQPEPEPAPEPAPEPEAPPSLAPAAIVRPTLLVDAKPKYPEQAWNQQLEADVVVLLTVDETGAVIDAEVVTPAGHGFDEQALLVARKLRFSPATVDGAAVAVQIRYTFRFRMPEKDTVASTPAPAAPCTDCERDTRKPATIAVTVYERGRGKRLPSIEVYLLDEDRVVLTDAKGRFEVTVPPGAYAFTIRPPGFYPYHSTERVEEGQRLELEYYVRRHRRARYSTIVWGTEGRAEVARTSLIEDEIRTVAGTMGDPIRVAMLLPGVASSVSGLGYPIIRGSLPGESLYEIDGIKVPMLYHLLFGPAVIHPHFVDEITFQPGGYSAEHGRFPGGRIAASTARVDDDPLWVADLSIIETSLLRSQKVGEHAEMVAAVRYGTLGYIIEGLAANTVFRYWDYQSRLAYRLPNGGKLTVTFLGASDTAGESNPETGEEEVLRLGFHTADVRYRQASGNMWLVGGAQLAHEFFEPPEDESDNPVNGRTTLYSARPYVEIGHATKQLELSAGGDVLLQDFGLVLPGDEAIFTSSSDTGVTVGAWTAAEWTVGKFLLNPSIRFDHYRYQGGGDPTATAVDPRFSAVFHATEKLDLKAAAGVYSGPSRFSFVEPPLVFGPIPAFEGPGLTHGLNRTYQYQGGIETRLPRDLELVLTGYYHDQHAPVDFSLIDKPVAADPTPCNGDANGPLEPLDVRGSSVGAEALLRRRLGKSMFGWVSYGLSRSQRTTASGKTFPFEFDQRHVLNAVLSWEVGRNWTLGGVFHYNTGRPYTPLVVDRCDEGFGGYYTSRHGEPNAARLPNYWRVDLRVQKREVFDTWFFDFYIDFFNAAFQWETIGYDVDYESGELEPQQVPLFIPTIGIRGEF
jgi:TonB family protein